MEGAHAFAAAGEPGQRRAVVVGQADADIAVEQPMPITVLGDQQQATGEPGRRRTDATAGEQRLEAAIERARTLRAFAQGGEQAQAAGLGQGGVRIGRAGQGAPVGEQPGLVRLQGIGQAFVQAHRTQRITAQQAQRRGRIAGTHGIGQRCQAQAGVLPPAPLQVYAAATQAARLDLHRSFAGTQQGRQRRGIFGQQRITAAGGGEDRGQHVAGLHRRQLVRIAEQHQLAAIGDRLDQLAHHRQVDHRGLVHHHDVMRQGMVAVVAEVRAVAHRAEQAMQGLGLVGHGRQQVRIHRAGFGQQRACAAQALGHAVGGAAGGRGQGDARRIHTGGPGLGDAQQQQAGDGGGLAGARAAGHQQQGPAQGQGGRTRLLVLLRLREQDREQRRDRIDAGGRQRPGGDPAQLCGQSRFVLAVAAQVQQAVLQHQRPHNGIGTSHDRCGHPRRFGQSLQPGRWRRPVQGGIDQQLRARRIETGMALRHRQRGQGSGGQHRIGRGRIQPAQAGGQGVVERAQRTGAVERGQQAHAAAPSCTWPNSASSACTSSGAKRCAWMPGESARPASSPRQNR